MALSHTYETLAQAQSEWSQATFGSDEERGPLGPLNHLKRELEGELLPSPYDEEEYADAFLLVLDAARRAGVDHVKLLELASKKLEINKARTWQKPNEDGSVEHVRD